jgi:hypothetical protein
MVKVYRSTVLNAPADRVWRDLRDFNGLANWHPSIVLSRIENGHPADKVGCIRNFQLKDGARIREKLLSLSDYDYTCVYSILDSPMDLSDYVASLRLLPVTQGNRCLSNGLRNSNVRRTRLPSWPKPLVTGCSRPVSTH